tara:strand:- start:151 stop:543 length:393 start_codon:yes stop_codon:yes gene_type:complete
MVGRELAFSRYLGTMIVLLITIAFTTSIIVIRSSRRENMLMALCLGGLVSGGISAIFVTDHVLTIQDLITYLYLGVFQAGVGFTLMLLGTRYIPAAKIALLAMVESVLAPIWVWMGVGEVPGLTKPLGEQ